MAESVISVRGLRTMLGGHIIHDDLDLDVVAGEVLGVVGASGTGKSVLLRTIIGLIAYRRGRIDIFGQSLTMLDRSGARARLGVLFQDGALFSSLTVGKNVQVPLREFTTLDEATMAEIAGVKLEMVGLASETATKYPSELSGGMRKRAGLARALALDPDILFLDEPTSGLDPIGAAAFDQLIGDLQKSLGFTVFMVTHDLDSLHTVCDRIAVLAEKRVILAGSMSDMLRSEHPWIRSYFHGPRARAAYGV